jgi:hypothetical protein
VGDLSGRKSLFLYGIFEQISVDSILVTPLLVGRIAPDLMFDYKYWKWGARWPIAPRIHAEQIDAFSDIKNSEKVTTGQLDLLKDIPESRIKDYFADIIREPFIPLDWGGERSDLYTSKIYFDGKPRSAAFAFKGPAKFKPLHPADLGKRGDQLIRLFDEPADIIFLQHCHKIETTVIKQMQGLASDPNHQRLFCVIDGAETIRILRTYGKLENRV